MGEAKRWLEKAKADFDDASFNREHDRDETAAFLFQQAAEKALKALQISETGDYMRSHNLVELAADRVPGEYRTMLADLNPAYTGFRYPDTEARMANLSGLEDELEELLEWITKRLQQ